MPMSSARTRSIVVGTANVFGSSVLPVGSRSRASKILWNIPDQSKRARLMAPGTIPARVQSISHATMRAPGPAMT
jgi:hypothetical protein